MIKAHSETLVFERARVCGSVPPSLDVHAVSRWCYYGDASSPFRDGALATHTQGLNRQERTNLVGVLYELRESVPTVWEEVREGIVGVQQTDRRTTIAKASFTLDALGHLPLGFRGAASLVRQDITPAVSDRRAAATPTEDSGD